MLLASSRQDRDCDPAFQKVTGLAHAGDRETAPRPNRATADSGLGPIATASEAPGTFSWFLRSWLNRRKAPNRLLRRSSFSRRARLSRRVHLFADDCPGWRVTAGGAGTDVRSILIEADDVKDIEFVSPAPSVGGGSRRSPK